MDYKSLFFNAFLDGCLATAKEMLPSDQYKEAVIMSDPIYRAMLLICGRLISPTPIEVYLKSIGTSIQSLEDNLFKWKTIK